MRSIVARRAYCVDISLVCSRFVQKRSNTSFDQIIFQLLRFPQISSTSENARPKRQSGPFFGTLFELFTFDRDVFSFKT